MIINLDQRDGYWEVAIKPSGGPNPMPAQHLQFDTLADVQSFAAALSVLVASVPK